VAHAAAKPPNSLQKSLSTAAVQLPTAGADIGAHLERLSSVPDLVPSHADVGAAAGDVAAHMKAFMGTR
jgi:phospholipase C